MSDHHTDFDLDADRVWINTAHQGALPRVASAAAREAIAWKQNPRELTGERFREVPERLRRALGRLVGAPADDMILANSSSYGLHLLANGYPWRRGDEVLLVRGDFPSTILPWLGLEGRGVTVRLISPAGARIGPHDIEAAMTPATRVFCTTWVHSFTGHAIDIETIGGICRDRGVAMVLNASQAIGARRFALLEMPVDAVTCVGFKWLCGPYGTGFCWIRPELRDRLQVNRAYWLAMLTADDLGSDRELPEPRDLGARKYDVFGTANFFNYMAWTASLEFLLGLGIDRIAAHDRSLVERFIAGLDRDRFDLVSPEGGKTQSTLILVSHREPGWNAGLHRALKDKGIDCALRRGLLRFSPHLYNSPHDIDRTLDLLAKLP